MGGSSGGLGEGDGRGKGNADGGEVRDIYLWGGWINACGLYRNAWGVDGGRGFG